MLKKMKGGDCTLGTTLGFIYCFISINITFYKIRKLQSRDYLTKLIFIAMAFNEDVSYIEKVFKEVI